MLPYNKNLKPFSRKLRTNMTGAERALWSKLRGQQMKGFHFYRQKPLGDFIADFFCPKARLVIELDGGQHFTKEGKAKDALRDRYMEKLGLRVLRFLDREVLTNSKGALELIWGCLENLP